MMFRVMIAGPKCRRVQFAYIVGALQLKAVLIAEGGMWIGERGGGSEQMRLAGRGAVTEVVVIGVAEVGETEVVVMELQEACVGQEAVEWA